MSKETYYRTKDLHEVIMEQLDAETLASMRKEVTQQVIEKQTEELTERLMKSNILKSKQDGLTDLQIAEAYQISLEEVQRFLAEPIKNHHPKEISTQLNDQKTIEIFPKNEEETCLIETLLSKMNVAYSLK